MKRLKHWCSTCGGLELVEAIDNYGNQYKGCARCRIVSVTTANCTEKEAKP